MHKITHITTKIFTGVAVSGLLFSQAFAAENYTPSRTDWGVPDLQGIWNYENRTSLERPDLYGGALEIDEATMLAKMVSTPDYIAAL